ncbi:hypothetical protein [Kitasatospora sp. NPDC093679]|uniref:hypothetical protein n=1 Tax=Kitasatospora sp. NPDC093679 TaxID=3154983 RepID=UPI0034182739
MRVRNGLLAAALLTAPLTACGSAAEPPSAAAPTKLEIRTSTTELTARLPKLGRIVEAHWQFDPHDNSGGRVPGPSDYFIDAVMRLQPGTVAGLLKDRQAQDMVLPGTSSGLAAFLPNGAVWQHSLELDRELARASSATFWFDPASDSVYLAANNLSVPETASPSAG